MGKNDMKISNRRRILFLFGGTILVMVLLIIRLAWVQVVDSSKLQEMAYDQQTRDRTINSSRGTIYSSDGKVLAISASMETISVTPAQVKNSAELSQKLADLLTLDYDEVYEKVTSKSALVTIAKNVDKETTDNLREWISETETKGVKIDESTKRYYPNNSLASHVLGFVGTDNQGLYGIEKTYDMRILYPIFPQFEVFETETFALNPFNVIYDDDVFTLLLPTLSEKDIVYETG